MKEELNEILFREKWSKKELADQLLMSPAYVRKCLMESAKGYPHWVRAFVVAYKLGKMTGKLEAQKEYTVERKITTDLRTGIEKSQNKKDGGWRERLKNKSKNLLKYEINEMLSHKEVSKNHLIEIWNTVQSL